MHPSNHTPRVLRERTFRRERKPPAWTRSLHVVALTCVIALCGQHAQADADDLKPFPAAEPGYARYVIRLEPRSNEQDLKLELLVGKELEADCNQRSFVGDITEHNIEGWGYTYYAVREIRGPASTLMACPPDSAKQIRFVAVPDRHGPRRYNSKLPVVIHVPAGFEVRYRVWSASAETGRAVAE